MTFLKRFVGYKVPNKRDSKERYKMSDATKKLIDSANAVVHDLQDERWYKTFPIERPKRDDQQ